MSRYFVFLRPSMTNNIIIYRSFEEIFRPWQINFQFMNYGQKDTYYYQYYYPYYNALRIYYNIIIYNIIRVYRHYIIMCILNILFRLITNHPFSMRSKDPIPLSYLMWRIHRYLYTYYIISYSIYYYYDICIWPSVFFLYLSFF